MTVEEFVAAHIPGCERGFENCTSIGFDAGGDLVAGVVYHNWSPESGVIELSSASKTRRWLTRERLKIIFEYPFNQLGCRLIVARTSEHNSRVRRIFRQLGAREFPIPELRGPGEAEIVITLSAQTWRDSRFSR